MSSNTVSPFSLSPSPSPSPLTSGDAASSSHTKINTDPSSSIAAIAPSQESLSTLKSLIHESMTRFATLTEKYLDALSSNFNEPSTPPNPEEQNKNQKLLSELVDVDRQLASYISESKSPWQPPSFFIHIYSLSLFLLSLSLSLVSSQ